MRASVDIETALYELLTADNYSASAHNIPVSLGETLPHIHVVQTGGTEYDMVIEQHNVDFDVYAADTADAMEYACNLCVWVRNLSGEIVGTQCYAATITTLPYNNPDPRHADLARATFKALIRTRTKGA